METSLYISELKEFGSFNPCGQRFIKRSLLVAREVQGTLSKNEETSIVRWSRNRDECSKIVDQRERYQKIRPIQILVPSNKSITQLSNFIGPATILALGDLLEGKIASFSEFRFLYERLIGAKVRPWLPAIFVGAAALPNIESERRKILLQSISEAAATAPGWSDKEPTFFPEWVEKEAV